MTFVSIWEYACVPSNPIQAENRETKNIDSITPSWSLKCVYYAVDSTIFSEELNDGSALYHAALPSALKVRLLTRERHADH